MVPVQGDAVLLVAGKPATASATAIRAVVATTHTLHIHVLVSILKLMTCAARPTLVETMVTPPRLAPILPETRGPKARADLCLAA